MKGFLLSLVAIFLFLVVAPIGFMYQCISNFFEGLNIYFFKIALSIDQAGNVVCSGLFNSILIKKSGPKFGNEDETISSVLGKNKKQKTLTLVGKFLAYFLNTIDKNHVDNAVED